MSLFLKGQLEVSGLTLVHIGKNKLNQAPKICVLRSVFG